MATPENWTWGYFAWRSSCRDTLRLATWQQQLVRAAREQGAKISFAVGYVGMTDRDSESAYIPTGSGRVLVLYLHEDVEPTEALAAKTVANL
jgi:hypothetical protein